jgi:hypothetical protein
MGDGNLILCLYERRGRTLLTIATPCRVSYLPIYLRIVRERRNFDSAGMICWGPSIFSRACLSLCLLFQFLVINETCCCVFVLTYLLTLIVVVVVLPCPCSALKNERKGGGDNVCIYSQNAGAFSNVDSRSYQRPNITTHYFCLPQAKTKPDKRG